MGRTRQGSGGSSTGVTPAPVAPAMEQQAVVGVGDQSVDNLMPRATPGYAQPGPQALDASPPAKTAPPAKAQSFAGRYHALARLNLDNGTIALPDSVVELTDAEAKHFLKSKVVKPAARVQARKGDTKKVLHDGQDYTGEYITNFNVSRDNGDRVPPEQKLHLADAEARHFLKLHAVRSASGLEI